MVDRSDRVFDAIPMSQFLLRQLIVTCILLMMGACSTYYSHYYQKPIANSAGWQIRSETSELGYGEQFFADYTDDQLSVSVTVPFSGSRQQFAGPPLLPFLPIKKDKPHYLDIHFHIRTLNGEKYEANPGKWNAITKGEDPMSTFPVDEVKTARPFRVIVKNKISGKITEKAEFPENWKIVGINPTMIRIFYFDAYDLSFFQFTITNMTFVINGIRIDLPPLVFERKSRGNYNPYTPQFLEVL